MKIKATRRFLKVYTKLPKEIKAKVKKALVFLKSDPFYPSLHTKKIWGIANLWEARVDIFYRLTYQKEGEVIILEDVGPHDKGLGKR